MLKALNLDSDWGQRCQDTLALVDFYGINGERYEDPRVIDMINDTGIPKPNIMDKFLRLLKAVDRTFTEEMLGEAALLSDRDE